MEPINARSMLDAVASASADRPPVERRRRLSQAALAVTNQKVRRAYSPIVIAGAVRVADFVLLTAIGVALYLGYVVPLSGFYWEYIAAIFGILILPLATSANRTVSTLGSFTPCARSSRPRAMNGSMLS